MISTHSFNQPSLSLMIMIMIMLMIVIMTMIIVNAGKMKMKRITVMALVTLAQTCGTNMTAVLRGVPCLLIQRFIKFLKGCLKIFIKVERVFEKSL